MGRVARAAATVAAPEAAAARRITPGMAPGEVHGELQRRRAAAAQAKAARASAPGHPMVPAASGPAPTSPGTGPALPAVSLPAPVSQAASTGSGFLLGVFAWAVGLAYLRGGTPEVRKFFRAKFFNQT